MLDLAKLDAGFGNDVIGTINPRLRRTWRNGGARIDNNRQHVVLEVDRRRGVLCQRPAVRNDENERLAHVRHFPFNEN